MKKLVILGLLILVCANCTNNSNSGKEIVQNYSDRSPLEVVNKRMQYFNEHNYKEFIKLYDTDVAIYTYPDKLIGKGSDRLASIFKSDFENKLVSVKIVSQMHNGSYVINHEIVTNSGKTTKYISIYKVERGLITKVRFVR